jgi:hypothetical protein
MPAVRLGRSRDIGEDLFGRAFGIDEEEDHAAHG